jgi:hypothetical protein
MKRMLVGVVIAIVAVVGAVPAGAASKPSAGKLFPPRIFGKVQHAKCVADPTGDFGFFNGKAAGRHDAFVDIRGACDATIAADAARIKTIEDALPCGSGTDTLVICGSPHASFSSGELVVYSWQVHGPVPLQVPNDETMRISLFIDAGGPATSKAKATTAAPDVSSQGANVTYQVIFNDPGTTATDVELLAIDRRKPNEFFPTDARAWIDGDTVVFVIPKSEVGGIKGVRGAAFISARTAQGDVSRGAEDVVPGRRHAPFGFIPYVG